MIHDPTPDPAGFDLSFLAAAHGGLAGHGRGKIAAGDECSTPDPSRYHAASSQFTSIDGAPLSAKMCNGRWGLQGTVVPRATYFGGSQGWNPHRPPDSNVTVVDPYDQRLTFKVDLARVTAQTAREALRVVEEAAGAPKSIDDLRTKQAATFHVLHQMAAQTAPRAVDDRGRASPGGDPAMFGRPHEATTPPPSPFAPPPPAAAPAPIAARFDARFDAPEYMYPPRPPAPAPMAPPPPPPAPPRYDASFFGRDRAPAHAPAPATIHPVGSPFGPVPTHRVTFATPDGSQEGMFHSVARVPGEDGRGGVLILGLEAAYTGPKFVPRRDASRLVVHEHDAPTVLLVDSIGLRHEHKGELLMYFEITDERPV